MRLDIAQGIQIKDKVYNCFRDELTVIGKTEIFNQYTRLDRIEFVVTDKNSNKLYYNYTDLYLNTLEDECDEEASWVLWASQNRNLIEDLDLDILRKVYMCAFDNGYEYRKNIKYHEMMQK